ncbi:MAG: hypothetical protein ACKO5E_12780 [bacterium]
MSDKKPETNRQVLILFLILISTVFVCELAGLEVTGGDPDRFFRPLKSELVRNIKQFQLPLWSDLFGFGMPLAAQSEIGAFYLPHYFIYGIFGVGSGYRLSMVLHQALAAFFIWKLSRRWNSSTLGCMMAVLIYIFGGFPTVQASKEWAVLGMAWLPGAYLGTEIWLESESKKGIALLGLSLACLALIGHFQMAQLTSLGLFLWVLARMIGNRQIIRKIPGLIMAVVIAICVASPQLALSWQYAEEVGATDRSFSTLAYYSYPTLNFLELIFPLWTRTLAGGPEGAYWTIHQTTQFEACQFVGSCGIIFAILGLCQKESRKYSAGLLLISIISIAISTMPQWSPQSYASILQIPGMGLFRCPARYGVLLHFALAMLASLGSGGRLRKIPLIMIISVFTISYYQLIHIPDIVYNIAGSQIRPRFDVAKTIIAGTQCFLIALFLASRQSARKPLWQAVILLFLFSELMYFYYAGPTRWGKSLDMIHTSSLLESLTGADSPGSLCGPVDNMPVVAGSRTVAGYFGVKMPPANEMAKGVVESIIRLDQQGRTGEMDAYLRRLGATHQLHLSAVAVAKIFKEDPLAKAISALQGRNQPLYLRKIENPQNAIAVFNGQIQKANDDNSAFLQWLNQPESTNNIYYSSIKPELVNEIQSMTIDRNAVVEPSGDLRKFRIKHSGSLILILRMTFDQGWKIKQKNMTQAMLFPLNGGLTGLLVKSTEMKPETTEIELYYWPDIFNYTLPIAAAGVACLILLVSLRESGKTIRID